MKARPILYTAPMVLAEIENRKNQTRRIRGLEFFSKNDPDNWHFSRMVDGVAYFYYKNAPMERAVKCPYGKPGDLLWVRETCVAKELSDDEAVKYAVEHGEPEYPVFGLDGVLYPADAHFRPIENSQVSAERWVVLHNYRGKRGAVVPGIHMPRWASRLTNRLTSVSLQQLRDISREDAIAEGLKQLSKDGGRTWKFGIPDRDGLPGTDDFGWHWADWNVDPRQAYFSLWSHIHGDEFGLSSWIWVLKFEVIKANVDQVLKEAA